MSRKVLIVDDSKYMRTLINDMLTKAGYEVIGEAHNGETAIDMAIELNPEVITLDNILPDMIGLDILKVLKEEGIQSKIVMVSAVGQQSIINKGLELGAIEYITKPFTSDDLIGVLSKI